MSVRETVRAVLTTHRLDCHWLLIIMRDDPRREQPDFLALPGGGVNDGEMPLAAVLRELREETGLHGGFGPIGYLGAADSRHTHLFTIPLQTPGLPQLTFNGHATHIDAEKGRYLPAWIPVQNIEWELIQPASCRELAQLHLARG